MQDNRKRAYDDEESNAKRMRVVDDLDAQSGDDLPNLPRLSGCEVDLLLASQVSLTNLLSHLNPKRHRRILCSPLRPLRVPWR